MADPVDAGASGYGPVRPSPAAAGALTPAVVRRVAGGGFWDERQRVNREVTIPLGADRLEDAGNLENFRMAAGLASGPYSGPVFSDSDVYKWLEAVAWEQGRAPSPDLARQYGATAELVASAQTAEGYLDTYYQLAGGSDGWFDDLAFGHELYCAGHLLQAGVAERRATGGRLLLEVSQRLAAYLAGVFGHGLRHGVPGHPEVEMALVELFRETGDGAALALASYFVEARGRRLLGAQRFEPPYFQDHLPLREQSTLEGHAVRALYLACGATDVASETGDDGLRRAVATQWQSMVGSKMYLTGGLGSRWEGEAFGDPFELPADLAYCETCAAIGSVMWSWRMLLATGHARYADLIERTMFNAVLPGVSLDGGRFSYVNPLQVRSAGEQVSERSASLGRRPWFGCACCPPNLMRMLASWDHYFLTASERGIQVHQYGAGTLSADTGHGRVVLRLRSEYPWDGAVDIEVLEAPGGEWELALRAPEWCTAMTTKVNGEPASEPAEGYVRLVRGWAPGDEVQLDLPMVARRTVADRRVDAVRGCVALERGPLVYCFEDTDLPAGSDVGLLQLPEGPLEAHPVAGLSQGMVGLRAEAAMMALDGGGLYGRPGDDAWAQGAGQPCGEARTVQATAVPYFAWGNRGLGAMRVWVPTK